MHDSQEFLAFLIDALHESLNKSSNGRYMEIKDYVPGESEEDYFKMSEDYLKSHHDSYIYDLMYGRLKNEIICPGCSHPSLKYDSFSILSLPLASDASKQHFFFLGEFKFYELVKVTFLANSREDLRILQAQVCSENALNLPKDRASFYEFDRSKQYFHRIRDYKFDFKKYILTKNVFLFLVYDMIDVLQPDPMNIVQAFLDIRGVDRGKTFGVHKPVMVSRELPVKNLYEFIFECMESNIPSIMRGKSLQTEFQKGSKGFNGPFSIYLGEQEISYSDSAILYFKGDEQIFVELKLEGLRNSAKFTKIPDKDPEISLNHDGMTSLDTCLNLFTRPELLDEHNKFKCSKCNKEQQANLQQTLKTVPPILMLHLKRFRRGKVLSKNDERIKIPFQGLDLSPYVTQNEQGANRPPLLYDLYGVICHFGSLNKGHYTALVRHKENWYYCDDETITLKRTVDESSIEESAYILFYRQRPMSAASRNDQGSIRGSRLDGRRAEIQRSNLDEPHTAQPVRVSQFALMDSAGKKSTTRS
jgi:Ubiquitin carboxyl-terminal hydrolase